MLEEKIEALTAAVEKLNTTMAILVAQGGPVNAETLGKSSDKPVKTKPAAKKAEPKKAEPEPEEKAALTYDDVKRAAVNLANTKGREALVKVLKEHGLKTAQDADESQWPALVDALNALS